MKPICFIIMPFGTKKFRVKGDEDKWIKISFDDVYSNVIYPAIKDAGMEPIRADKDKSRGIIHKPMFERIILSDYVVADLTGANANVFYELGIRHAVKPYTTISIFAANSELPFDLAPFKAFAYEFSEDKGVLKIDSIKDTITTNLIDAKKNKLTDSPIYQLVNGINFQNSLAHEKTDIFRDVVKYNNELKDKLKAVRLIQGNKIEKIKALEQLRVDKLSPIEDQEGGVLIDIMLSYRDIEDYEGMEKFIVDLPIHIQQTIMVQEQYGFALNRNKKRDEAIVVLEKLINNHGPSSETYGILGRVFKDYVTEYYEKGKIDISIGYIDRALDTYKKGFEADWRDAYPGINYLTCLELKGSRESINDILPVVEYSVLRKKEKKKPDYWDEATLLELAVINKDIDKAKTFYIKAIMANPAEWMLKSTNKNLMMIRYFRNMRNENTDELDKLIELFPKPE